MRQIICCIVLLLPLACFAGGWDWWPIAIGGDDQKSDSVTYGVSLSGLSSSGEYAPFWLQSKQHGRIASAAHSGYLTAYVEKRPGRTSRWYDYDGAVELTGSLCSGTPLAGFQINRLYAHARLYVFDVTAGFKPFESFEPQPSLSSGNLLFSGNERPMPRISVGIDDYMPFPGLFGYLEVKGHITHAWLLDDPYVSGAYLHYKYAGARLGGKLPVNISYEFHHAAQWGGTSPEFGDLGNSLGAYINAFVAGAGGTMLNDIRNAQGNHLVVQQLQLDVKHNGWKASAYWQQLFEDNSLSLIGCGTNLADGLWGLNISQDKWPFISSLTLEYLGTTDQSGPFHDQDGIIYAGKDNYYRNYVYTQGWTYYGRTIGTPFITSPIYNKDGYEGVVHNRAKVWHLGLQGDIYGFRYRALSSYARTYGSYDTEFHEDPYAIISTNTALLLEVNKHVEKAWGLDFGVRLGADLGSQFGNTFGAMLTITKQGLITQYTHE